MPATRFSLRRFLLAKLNLVFVKQLSPKKTSTGVGAAPVLLQTQSLAGAQHPSARLPRGLWGLAGFRAPLT